ncbi:MAG TPA: bifunctional phosphoribosylaminoimidazolecarboxamide formyltransferase/IMP cyclohydrolase [Candidatus Tetragenococcus pullicola]|nr:bifunctional phosphoribosylaminoimidazolecarboxamide formyltransferase/IMP cyclohydrolase [Candidatus Tetragenococcus pullicola]
MRKRALISVSDKKGIASFAKKLSEQQIEIISTGGTKKELDQAGIPTTSVEEITGFPEMLDGRVKTLHPKIHGGLLGKRSDQKHVQEMEENEIAPIDFVVVNLYPFKEMIQKEEATQAEAIENIDIGGPSMLRSAAKNFADVTVIIDPNDYDQVLEELEDKGQTTLETRKKLAAKVFRHTAFYDALIAEYFTNSLDEIEPEKMTLAYEHKQALRYGENSHQKAAFYQSALPESYSLASAKQLHGKELSFNNIRDADAAIRIIRDFEEPTVVALKHMNPCGIGIGDSIYEAYIHAYEADPVSIFGGILVLNRNVDVKTAEKMHQLFLEIVIAPSYDERALEILEKKKNIRLLTMDFAKTDKHELEKVSVLGGLLVQEQDLVPEDPSNWQVVTKRQPNEKEFEALKFAWKAVKYVKSNAILLANEYQTVGVGAGQMNRVGSVKIAIEQAEETAKMKDAVLASDAFFPMDDSVEYAAQHGIRAIIQPGGSIKDQDSIDMADKYGITMVFTKVRHFRH